MSSCDHLQMFLDGRLGAEEADTFSSHLASCPECRAEVERWKDVEFLIETELAEDALRRRPTSADTDRLIERRRAKRGSEIRRIGPPARWAFAAAAAVAIGFLAFVFMRGDPAARAPARQVDKGTAAVAAPAPITASIPITVRVFDSKKPSKGSFTESVGVLLDAPEDGRLVAHTDRDHFGLAPSSRVRVLALDESATRLGLERGTVACSVASRSGEDEFVVETGKVSVRVIGTRFSVTRKGGSVDVRVAEGAVVVKGKEVEARVVKAGSFLRIVGVNEELESGRLESDALQQIDGLLSESAPSETRDAIADASVVAGRDAQLKRNIVRVGSVHPKPEDSREVMPQGEEDDPLEVWRRWVIEGKLQDAEKALRPYVALKPRDHEAWSLLAHCLRKEGKWEEAVGAYREVITIAPKARANRARFKAGAILQDKLFRHREAIETFDEYLTMAGAKSLEVEAKIRLARSYGALGDNGKTRKILEDVVNHHGGTAGAAKAKQLLVNMNED